MVYYPNYNQEKLGSLERDGSNMEPEPDHDPRLGRCINRRVLYLTVGQENG